MYRTKNDLPERMRATVAHLLNARLAELIDLQLQAKHAHWNVKGTSFIALHELFDEVASAVREHVDLVAERIVQLGGVAEGTLQAVADKSQLNVYSLAAGDWVHHVERLSAAIAVASEGIRAEIDKVSALGDAVSAGILTGICQGLDKWLWFVEAHLQRESVRSHVRPAARKGSRRG